MATLKQVKTGQKTELLFDHLFGLACTEPDTALFDASVSPRHASIIWARGAWLLRDYSASGTYVNDESVFPGSDLELKAGDEVKFGGLEQEAWLLLNVDPPTPLLFSLSKGVGNIFLKENIMLPTVDGSKQSVCQVSEGRWIYQNGLAALILKNGDRLGAKESMWRFVEPASNSGAPTGPSDQVLGLTEKASIQSVFQVSQNEEHVSLKLKVNELEIDLKQRIHHYLLLMLARKRIQDKSQGFGPDEQGWLDKGELCHAVGLNESHLNIQIHRFRKQLSMALPIDVNLPKIIDKRHGQIRFDSSDIRICGGFQM